MFSSESDGHIPGWGVVVTGSLYKGSHPLFGNKGQ